MSESITVAELAALLGHRNASQLVADVLASRLRTIEGPHGRPREAVPSCHVERRKVALWLRLYGTSADRCSRAATWAGFRTITTEER